MRCLGLIVFVIVLSSAHLRSSAAQPAAPASVHAEEHHIHDCGKAKKSTICIGNRPFRLVYNKAISAITLKSASGQQALRKITKGYEPELIGAEKRLAFLPPALQPYGARQVLLYTAAVRSTGGNGQGQCGAGEELFLHALDVGAKKAKVLSSVLIGSCLKDIYLYETDTDMSDNFSIVDGQLAIKFISYPAQQGSPITATLANDFKNLDFIKTAINSGN